MKSCPHPTWALLFAVSTFLGLYALPSQAQEDPTGPSIIGIDHLPTAVRDLDQATTYFQGLGFAIKPGRPHSNGLRTNNIKFPDGSGIELITTGGADSDNLSAYYTDFLKTADGPAYVAFHVRDVKEMNRALERVGVQVEESGLLNDPLLDFLFLVEDNRSPTDRPEHFAHTNSAIAMSGVWLALDSERRDRFRQLLLSMGALETLEALPSPIETQASIFRIQNGRVVVLPASSQLYPGRPIVGVEFQVREFAETLCNLQWDKEHSSPDSPDSPASRRCVLSPADAHGMWVEFHQ